MLLDGFAYSNRLRNIHPGEKMAFSLITMVIGFFPSIYSCGLIILIIAAAVILIGKVPVKTYLRLMLLPVFFLVASLLPILINTGVNPDSTLIYFIFFKSTIGITYNSLIKSGLLFMRSMALVSCLYFISLTTPILDIIAVMKKLKLPDILIDLMFLVYRQLFVMMDTAESIYVAQNARLGYATFSSGINSLGRLVSYLIIKSCSDAQRLYTALVSRGYEGELKVLEPSYKTSIKNIILIAAIDTVLLIIALKTGGTIK
jgi:cobalt/nickel transport system permease protein